MAELDAALQHHITGGAVIICTSTAQEARRLLQVNWQCSSPSSLSLSLSLSLSPNVYTHKLKTSKLAPFPGPHPASHCLTSLQAMGSWQESGNEASSKLLRNQLRLSSKHSLLDGMPLAHMPSTADKIWSRPVPIVYDFVLPFQMVRFIGCLYKET